MEAEFLLIEPAGVLQKTGICQIEDQNAEEQGVEVTEYTAWENLNRDWKSP